jgi:hypothetical protein
VIGPSGNIRVLVATKPVDFRKGRRQQKCIKTDRKFGFDEVNCT